MQEQEIENISITFDEFIEIASDILESIVIFFDGKIKNVEVVVENLPSEDELNSLNLKNPYQLLGLYKGCPYPFRGRYTFVTPDKITLYKLSIELKARKKENIPKVIEEVLIHEIGHYLGLDDSQIKNLELAKRRLK